MSPPSRSPYLPDQQVRQRIRTTTGRSLLVEAGAGTGKTTLIVDRLVQGVLDGSIRMPRAVVITFTRKAAGELEVRVRQALQQAASNRDLSDEQRERALEAIGALDQAVISTTHSFCARMLREKPAEAGIDPQFEVLEEGPSQILRRRCWQAWMERQVTQEPRVLLEALRAGVSVAALRDMARALLDAPEVVSRPEFRLELPSMSEVECLKALREHAADVAASISKHMRRNGNKASRAVLEEALRICEAEGGETALRRSAYRLAAIDPEAAITSFGEEVRDLILAHMQSLLEPARALGARLACDVFDWLRRFLDYYGQQKRSRSVLDFQDLLLGVAQMLRDNAAARRYFQQRYSTIFVDEFQDTDPLQAEIVGFLCEEPSGPMASRLEEVQLAEGKLLIVGDPKQSIYRFRRADVQVYDRFKGLFANDGVERIQCNFRSTAPLLNWLNRLFSKLFDGGTRAGVFQAEAVDLLPPADRACEGPSVVAVPPPPDWEHGKLHVGQWRSLEARFLARTVRQLVQGECEMPGAPEHHRPGDFVFLFRAMTDIGMYEDALDAYGIPYRVVGGRHFYQREQTAETIALLRAVDDPLDEMAVVAALRSSYFGLSDEDLLRHRLAGGRWNYLRDGGDGPVREALGLLARWHQQRNANSPHILLRQIIDITRARETFLMKPAGRQRVSNLDKILDTVRALGETMRSFGDVVAHLTEAQVQQLREEDSAGMEPGDEFVRLMTVHGAKGLQSKVVVLPALMREFRNIAGVGRLIVDRSDGRVALRVASGLQTPDYERLRDIEHANIIAEESRLLYVACTRAERLLLLGLHWGDPHSKGCFQSLLERAGAVAERGDIPYGEDRDGVHYLDTTGWMDTTNLDALPPRLPESKNEQVETLLKQRSEWTERHQELVCLASEGIRVVQPSQLEADMAHTYAPVKGTAAEPGGREFGTLFHRVLADASWEFGLTRLRELAVATAHELGMGSTEAEEAARLAAKALGDEAFRLVTAGAELWREVPFCVPLSAVAAEHVREGGYLEGSIDLLVRRGAQTTIVDYKTDRIAERGAEQAAETYWPQLGLYAMALQACELAGPAVELIVYFVRHGRLVRRLMDEDLRQRLANYL